MIRRAIDPIRRLRIKALMAGGLANWREVSARPRSGPMFYASRT